MFDCACLVLVCHEAQGHPLQWLSGCDRLHTVLPECVSTDCGVIYQCLGCRAVSPTSPLGGDKTTPCCSWVRWTGLAVSGDSYPHDVQWCLAPISLLCSCPPSTTHHHILRACSHLCTLPPPASHQLLTRWDLMFGQDGKEALTVSREVSDPAPP